MSSLLPKTFARTPALRHIQTRAQKRFLHASTASELRPIKAAVLTATTPDEDPTICMEVQTIGIQRPKRGEVLVKNAACGVCHTDLHVMKNHIAFPIPAVMGHETAGEIVELGEGVSLSGSSGSGGIEGIDDLKVGDRVISTFIMPCGSCRHCNKGNEDICETFFKENRLGGKLYDGTSRLQKMDGVSAGGKYSVIPATAVYKLPPSLPHIDSAIVGCALFTAYGSIVNAGGLSYANKNTSNPHLSAVVFGVGGVGSNIIQILKAFGVGRVIAVDRDSGKLDFAKEQMGADVVVDVSEFSKPGMGKEEAKEAELEVSKKIFDLTNGHGADVSFEVIGNPTTFRQAVMSLGDGGRAVMTGIAKLTDLGEIPITHLVRRKIQVVGSYGAKARVDTREILGLLDRGEIGLGSISERFDLEGAKGAYEKLWAGKITGKSIVEF